MRAVAAIFLGLIFSDAHANQPYWICIDAQGHKSAQDTPCPDARPPDPKPVSSSRSSSPTAVAPRPNRPAVAQMATDSVKAALVKVAPLAGGAFLVLMAFAVMHRLFRKRRKPARLARGSVDPWPDAHSSELPLTPRSPTAPVPSSWSLDLLRQIEWKRFEELVQGFWTARGYRAEMTSIGADGGVDVMVYNPRDASLFAIAQCKHWSDPVGVKEVRELWGLVHHHQVKLGLYYGLSGYTPDARAFASEKHLQLIDGEQLLRQIGSLSADQQAALLTHVCRGDFRTPTCPRCDVKLVRRESRRGPFWGCPNYPRCHHTLNKAFST